MSTHACLPSMKPLGMEFGVRISYLRKKREAWSIYALLQLHMAWNVCDDWRSSLQQCCRLTILFTSLPQKGNIWQILSYSFLRLTGTEILRVLQKVTLGLFNHSKASLRLDFLTVNCPVSMSVILEGHAHLVPETLQVTVNKQSGPRDRAAS